jgi:hypothetical protein
MVNGKCGWLSTYVLTLLYLLLLAIAAREGERREKWEVGPTVVEACELPQLAREGLGTGALRQRWWWGQRTRRCRASGEARERERGRER